MKKNRFFFLPFCSLFAWPFWFGICDKDQCLILAPQKIQHSTIKSICKITGIGCLSGYPVGKELIRGNKLPLNLGEVMVEFRFKDNMCSAYILRPEYATPLCISLFEQGRLEDIFERINFNNPNSYIQLYQSKIQGSSLSDLIWTNKLSKHIKRGETVYYRTEGLLAPINPAAIFDMDKDFSLAEYCHWINVVSAHELTAKREENNLPNGDDFVKIYGGIDYETFDDVSMPTGVISQPRSLCFLPMTKRVAKFLDSLCVSQGIRSQLLSGVDATEESLFENEENCYPWLLHIGTHGLNYEKIYQDIAVDNNALCGYGITFSGIDPKFIADNMFGSMDGYLFATEVVQLSLQGTYLTAISACGNKEEGREFASAFLAAGSRYVLYNLWEVKDETSWAFYQEFYKHLLTPPYKTVKEAFLISQNFIRKRSKFHEPFYWASFILME